MLVTFIFWLAIILMMSCVAGMLSSAFNKNKGMSAGYGVVTAILLCILLFVLAPDMFGYGKVTSNPEELGTRLKEGVAYHLIHSERQGNSYVLLMNEFGTHKTLAVRWNIEPPELFLLVDSEIIAIQK